MNKKYVEKVSFVVGEERSVTEILRAEDVRPLFQGALKAGALEARLELSDGMPLCVETAQGYLTGGREISAPLMLEGEEAGRIILAGRADDPTLDGIAAMLRHAVDVVLKNNLKRLLTTEMHTSVVSQAYDELLEKNKALEISEDKYRKLAEQLEIKVEERTKELSLAHVRLLQQEKLASVGGLAAGLAHEINNPLGFITSNFSTLAKYAEKLLSFSEAVSALPLADEVRHAIDLKRRELKLDFIKNDLPVLLSQSLEGAERIKKIIADLKGFSHVDELAFTDFSAAEEIERALSIASSFLPADVLVEKNIQPVSRIKGNGAAFSQSILNILQNSAYARKEQLKISVSLSESENVIELTIADNGPGIPSTIRNRVFEPFFTTKPVGQGTGMGLAVVHDCVDSLGGTVTAEDSDEGGALLRIRIPAGLI